MTQNTLGTVPANQVNEEIKKCNWKICIVDDDEDVHHLSDSTFRNYRFNGKNIELVHFYSAKETIEALKKSDPQDPEFAVIFLDIIMADSGFEVIEFLREKQGNYITQIVVRTGEAGKKIQSEEEIVQQYAINDFLDKAKHANSRLRISLTTSIRLFENLKTLQYKNKEISMMCSILNEVAFEDMISSIDTNISENISGIILQIHKWIYTKQFSKITDDFIQLDDDCIKHIVQLKQIKSGNKINLYFLYKIISTSLHATKGGKVNIRNIKKAIDSINMVQHMKWIEPPAMLHDLYKALGGEKIGAMKKNPVKFIDHTLITLDEFTAHYSGEWAYPRLNWLEDLSDLIHLHFALVKDGCLTGDLETILHKILPNHYLTKGKISTEKSIKTTKANYTDILTYDQETKQPIRIWSENSNTRYKVICDIIDNLGVKE